MIKQRFAISGMECSGCVMAVEGAIEKLDGVKRADANYVKQIADVEYDESKTSAAKIMQAVSRAGYEATISG